MRSILVQGSFFRVTGSSVNEMNGKRGRDSFIFSPQSTIEGSESDRDQPDPRTHTAKSKVCTFSFVLSGEKRFGRAYRSATKPHRNEIPFVTGLHVFLSKNGKKKPICLITTPFSCFAGAYKS